ncbi:MAG: phosphatase PAP2 family protein [Chromatiales bacterium]|nr:phosphatase PAP2 family protein [Chromatiales bacterium]
MLETITRYDADAFRWVLGRRNARQFAQVCRWISHLGDGLPYALLGFGLFLWEPLHGKAFLLTGLLAFAIELPAYLLLKNTVRRNRPQDAIGDFVAHIVPSDRFSFPSGHTAAAFVMATLVGGFYPGFLAVAVTVAGMIGASRVFLGVHFPTDILAGVALGHASALLALAAGIH